MDTKFIRENKPIDISPSSQAWLTDKLNQALDEYDTLCADIGRMAKQIEKQRTALQRILIWSKAYPLRAFPKPDLKKAREVLKVAGMTLDAISADAMRHVLSSVKDIVEQVLKETDK